MDTPGERRRQVCLTMQPDEYAHLVELARQCDSTPTGTVRRLIRATRVVRPEVVQPAELTLVGTEQAD